jgi:inhibitor of KinA sporulation pathway (predicted exonuclease)
MFTFGKPKCNLEALVLKIKYTMGDDLKSKLKVENIEIDCTNHKQGIDVTFSFVKPTLSPIRKKISHQIKAKSTQKQSTELVYQEVYEGLLRLGEIRLNEMIR